MKSLPRTFALCAGLLSGSVAFAQQGIGGGDMPQAAQDQPGMESQAPVTVSPQHLSNEEMRKVQSALNEAGYQAGAVDGIWGAQTETALRDFQQARGLEASGQLDEPTTLALGFSREEFAAAEFSDPSRLNEADIRRVQERLKSEGYDVGAVDGVWGPGTERALRQFQQAKGISETGRLNEETILALGFSTSEFAAGEFGQPGQRDQQRQMERQDQPMDQQQRSMDQQRRMDQPRSTDQQRQMDQQGR